jgi:hypothetical protein
MVTKKTLVYINGSEFEMVLESVSRRLHTFMELHIYLSIEGLLNLLLHSFHTVIATFRECTKSGRTFFAEYRVL